MLARRAVALCALAAAFLGPAPRRPVAPRRSTPPDDGDVDFGAADEPPPGDEPAAAAGGDDDFDDLSDLLGDVDDDDDDVDPFDDLELGGDDDAAAAAAAVPPPDDDDGLAELLRMGDATHDDSLEEEWQRRRAEVEEKDAREAARAEKRRLAAEAEEADAVQRGLGLLQTDPVCRGVVVAITRGSEADNATVAELETALKAAHGPRVEVCHNTDPEPEEDLPLLEVWLEGYRYVLLHARNWRGDGDLTPAKIDEIVRIVGDETSDDAELVLGTYPDIED